ncbi:phosphoribosylpyrophosphate synthetase [Rasiella sp. SM2506]|uniref:phosphoribosylpyrophosphate synthetase n=1 Tax=Rasiella sp. SM2506 TaxID=3423914 RepID=UPI003D7BB7E0
MDKGYSSLSVAIAQLQNEGYTEDFNLVEDGIESKGLKKQWKAGDCEVVRYFRFEGMTDPGDSSILYALETTDGRKGLLVDNYSAAGTYISEEMRKKLTITHRDE